MLMKVYFFGEKDRTKDEVDDAPIWSVRLYDSIDGEGATLPQAYDKVMEDIHEHYSEEVVLERIEGYDLLPIQVADKFLTLLGVATIDVENGKEGVSCWVGNNEGDSPITYSAVKAVFRGLQNE